MSAFGLAKQLGVDRKDAQAYVDLYFARYPGVKQYMERTREQAKTQGYVETIFGRRLFLPDINAKMPPLANMPNAARLMPRMQRHSRRYY